MPFPEFSCGVTPLHRAADCGDLGSVKILLIQGLNINSPTSRGQFTPVFFAIARNELKIVQFLLANGADVNHKAIQSFTPLSFATYFGYSEIVKLLLAEGADITTSTSMLNTPLHIAAERGYLNVVNALISKGLNVNAVNENEATPLHYAVENGHLDLVKILIAHGSHLNAGCTDKSLEANITPLHLAADQGKAGIAKVLLEAGANVNAKTNTGVTPLGFACARGFVKIVDVLLKAKADVGAKDFLNNTPLHLAVLNDNLEKVISLPSTDGRIIAREYVATALDKGDHSGNQEMLEILFGKKTDSHAVTGKRTVCDLLIQSGAKIDARNIKKWTPLLVAVWNDCPLTLVEMLVAKGANVNAKTSDGETVLHLAAVKNRLELVDILTQHGSLVNAKNTMNGTPLHCAALYGYLEIAKSLLDSGADPNNGSVKILTPLHISILTGNLKLTELLLQKGADVNERDGNCVTPLDIATMYGNLDIVPILLFYGACFETTLKNLPVLHSTEVRVRVVNYLTQISKLFKAVKSNDVKLVQKLVKEGVFIDARDVNGCTPLHLAVNIGNTEIVTSLLSRADPTVVTKKGNTALHVAVLKGFVEIVQLLLQHDKIKEFINVGTSNTNTTSLHIAAEKGSLEIVKSLLEHGAMYDIVNKKGKKPFDVSTDERVTDLLKFIKELFEAVKSNDVKLVQKLVKEDVFIDARDANGRTPLHLAVNIGNTEIVALLLSRADPTVVTKKGNTPLHIAVLKRFGEIVQLLLQHDKVKEFINVGTINTNTTSLHVAAENGSLEIVKSLLEHGAMYDIVNEKGKKPFDVSTDKKVTNLLKLIKELFEAVKNNDIQVVQKLVKEGVFIDARDANGCTPLHLAVNNGNTEIVALLLSRADPTVVTKKGNTALHVAVLKGFVEIVQLLLQHDKIKEFINVGTSNTNTTSLHIAAANGSLEIVKSLLEHGAMYDIVNKKGKKPFDVSTNKRVTNLLKLINDLFEDVSKGNSGIVGKLTTIKPAVLLAVKNARNNKGNTLLQISIVEKHAH